MLRSIDSLAGYHLEASDGGLGKIKDVLFDDHTWTVRYFVVDTGTWLPGRKVLISPSAAGEPDFDKQAVPVDLTVEQVKSAPSVLEDAPVSRQHEIDLAAHYGWPPYWTEGSFSVIGSRPTPVAPSPREKEKASPQGDPNLRSAREVTGYDVHAADGRIGHVDDFVAETDGWRLRYAVVDTGGWLSGRKVLVAVHWLQRVDWDQQAVETGLTIDRIRESPEYDPSEPVSREYEERLHDYYGRPRYWE